MIAIVGAGLTGLTLAHELARLDVPFVVLEAAPRPGGVIRSLEIDGHLLELGPQRARLTVSLARLVDELGLSDELVTAPSGLPLYVYAAGRLREVPFSAGAFARTDLLGRGAKARLLMEPLTRAPRPEESVERLLVRKFGREAYERLLGPLYGGLYASDPADMVVGLSLAHVLREFGVRRSLLAPLLRRRGRIDPPAAVSFRRGLQALTDALAAGLGPRLRLRAPVTGTTRARGGYRLDVPDGWVEAERVVVTTPAPAAAEFLRGVAPEAAARIASLRYNPLAVVHLHASDGLRALGYQVAFGEPLTTRGVTFNHALFGRAGVHTAYLGGAPAPEIVDAPDERISETAVREFGAATGLEARPISVHRERMPAWDRSWSAIRDLRLPEGIVLAANWESRPGIPGRLAQAARLARQLAGPASG